MEPNQWPSGFQPDALPLSYSSIQKIFYIKIITAPTETIKKDNHKKTKCFQFNWVIWSNLYLGTVTLIAIARTQITKVFKIKIM